MARGGARTWRWRILILLALWLVLPLIEIYLLSLAVPLFLDRYVIWVMPPFLALLACGVVALARLWRPLGLVTLGAIIALNLIGLAGQTGQPIKADFRAAAQFVMAHQRPGDVLVFQIPYNRYTFSYYDRESFAWMDGPYTNRGSDEASVAGWMERGVLGAPGVWLIESEAPLWDERGMTAQWLDTHGQITDQAAFARVGVIRYAIAR
jgi:hypothetical protein